MLRSVEQDDHIFVDAMSNRTEESLQGFSDGTHFGMSKYTCTPKFRWDILMRGWVVITSGFCKRTSAILEFYIRFRFWPIHRHRGDILHRRTKFHPTRSTHGRVLTSYRFFKMAAGSRVEFRVDNVSHPRCAIVGLSLVYKFGVYRLYSFGHMAILRF